MEKAVPQKKNNSHATYIKENSIKKFGITITLVVFCVISTEFFCSFCIGIFAPIIYWIFFPLSCIVSAVSILLKLKRPDFEDQFIQILSFNILDIILLVVRKKNCEHSSSDFVREFCDIFVVLTAVEFEFDFFLFVVKSTF